jgi:hypothetical protein
VLLIILLRIVKSPVDDVNTEHPASYHATDATVNARSNGTSAVPPAPPTYLLTVAMVVDDDDDDKTPNTVVNVAATPTHN